MSLNKQVDPAEHIARHWYEGLGLVELGVDFGECMVYDTLQLVNRAVVQTKAEEEKTE